MRKVVLLIGALAMSVLTIAGCGGGGSGGGGDGSGSANVAVGPTVEVNPATLVLPPGTSAQFTATLVAPEGSKQDVTGSVTWSSSAPSVASVTAAGVVNAVALGSAKITATTSGGISGSANVSVVALSSITITNVLGTMPVGINQQLVALGTFSDNSTQDLTSLVTWSSSNTAVATVSNAGDRKGWVTSLAPGPTAITATLAGVSGSVGITVTTATLTSLSIDQGNSTIAIGTVKRVSATGTFSDNSTHDVTSAASWSSSAPGVATVGSAPDSSGRIAVTAVAPGITTIAADLQGKRATVTVTVTSAHLVSIVAAPATPAVGLGIETVQFTALGTFSDNSVQDVTDIVTWKSSDAGIAVVSNDATPGLATTVGVGKSTITASTTAGVSATSVMTVNPPEPTITGVSPTFGPIGQEVHVRGTNFVKDLTAVSVNGIPATPVNVASSSFLTFAIPAGVTSSAVTITTPKGTVISTDVFTVGSPTQPPAVTALSPTLGPAGQTVTVSGANFIAGDTRVTIGGQQVGANVLDVDTLTFTVPGSATSPSTVTVSTSLGTAQSTATFTVGTPPGAPTVVSVDYSFGPVGAYRLMTGTNFVFGSTTINIGGLTGVPTTVYSPTTLSFTVPSGMAGNTKVTVVTPNGSADSPDVFVLTKR